MISHSKPAKIKPHRIVSQHGMFLAEMYLFVAEHSMNRRMAVSPLLSKVQNAIYCGNVGTLAVGLGQFQL